MQGVGLWIYIHIYIYIDIRAQALRIVDLGRGCFQIPVLGFKVWGVVGKEMLRVEGRSEV